MIEWTREALVAAVEAYEGLTPTDANPCGDMRAALDAAVKAQGLLLSAAEYAQMAWKAGQEVEQYHDKIRAEALEEAAQHLEEWAAVTFPVEEPEARSLIAAIRALKGESRE